MADIVAKVENRRTQKISRKLTLGFSAAPSLFSATTEIRDRFWMKRYGPSRRRAQNASAALKIFVRHPKKTFATISASNRPRTLARPSNNRNTRYGAKLLPAEYFH